MRNIYFILTLFIFFTPFITWGQMASDSTLVPAACYNFVDDFENDNGTTNCNEPDSDPDTCIEALEPNGGTGIFIEAEELCLNGNNKHYQMTSDQGLDVDNGSLLSTDTYTIELLFRVDNIPPENDDGRIFIMNFFNQNKAGLFISPEGYLCFYPNSGTPTCGPDLVSPDYPDILPSDWINIAVSFENNQLIVYLNGEEQFSLNGNEFRLQNQTSYFVPSNSLNDNPVADITVDYIRYFDEVLDATSIESLNMAAVAGDNITIDASATEGCIGDVIQLAATGGARTYYIWSTGDTTELENETFNYTIFQETDTIWVQGLAVSPCDRKCFDVADTIIITGFPLPEIGIVGPLELCENESVTFSSSADPASITSYAWSTTGSTSASSGANSKDYSVTFDDDGVYDVILDLTNVYDCTISDTIQVTVSNVPTTTVNAPASTCEGDTINIEYTGDAGVDANFNWNFGEGVIINENVPDKNFDVRWDSLGTKTIYLEIDENNCLVSDSFTIEITKRPTLIYSAPDSICGLAPAVIQYTGNADSTALFTWDFDGGVNSGDSINASVVWATTGTKNLNLQIDQGGCISDTTFSIEVLPVPTTSFIAPANVCSGTAVNILYTGTASGDAELIWNLDGGTTTNVNVPDRDFDVEWTTLGTKEIRLTISQDGCDTDTTYNIAVGRTPNAKFELPATACVDEPVRILYIGDADLASGSLSFDWNFGGGTATPVGGGQVAYDVVWDSDDTKTVTLEVTENGCTSEQFSQDIEISPKPIIDFDPVIPTSICNDETITFNFSGDAGANGVFDWNIGDASKVNIVDDETEFDLEWASAGSKTVSLTIDNDGCRITQTFDIEVLTPASTEVNLDAYACENEFTRLVYNGTGDTDPASGTTFVWHFGGADEVVDLGNEVYDLKWETFDAGTPANNVKEIILIIDKDGCAVSDTFAIEVTQKAVPVIAAPDEACVNQPITVEFSSNLSGAVLESFSVDSGDSTATADPEIWQVSWATVGTKTISLTYSFNGCDSTVTHEVEVFPIPSDLMSVDTEICDNETANFTYQGSGTPDITWNMPSGVTFSQVAGNNRDIEITFPITGTTATYTIEAEISNGTCTISFTEDVIVHPAPNATIPDPGTVCSSDPVVFDLSAYYIPAASYSWNWDGGIVESNSGTGIWTVSWESADTKNISLSVLSENSCLSKDSLSIDVGFTPEIALTVPEEVCDNDDFIISYDGDMSGVTNFEWTEEDGGNFTPNGANSWTVNFSEPGVKTVSLQIDGGPDCSVDTTFNIIVNSVPDFELSSDNTCTGVVVVVSFTGAFSPGIDTTWTFQDGISQKVNDSTYAVEFISSGTKDITLSMTGGGCGDQSLTKQVEVIDGPDYTVDSNDEICLDGDFGISVSQSAETDVSITNVELIPAGDGASVAVGGLFVLINGWDYGGEKQAILEITDNGASGCDIQYDTVNYIVYNYVEFELSSDNVCVNESVTLRLTSLTPADAVFDWRFGDANVSTVIENEEYQLSWNTPGDRTVGLEISSSCNATFNDITINVGDPADLSLDFEEEVCEGEVAQITYDMGALDLTSSVSEVEIKYLSPPFDFSNDDPANGIFAPVWNTAGLKTFRLIVNNGGCIDSIDYEIQVNEIPVASFSRSDNRVCVGETVSFVFNGTLPQSSTPNWNFNIVGDDWADISINPDGANYDVVWQTPGDKIIELIVNNGVCSDTLRRTVQVDPFPDLEINVPADICANAPFKVSLINNGTGTLADFEYDWNFDGATTVSDLGNQVYEITYPNEDSYTISVDITNSGGCNNSLSENVTVNPSPNIVYDAGPLNVCVGDDFTFTYTGVAGTDYTGSVSLDFLQLSGGVRTPVSVTESTITWDSAGTKEVRVAILDEQGCPSVAVVQVNVLPLPTMTYEAPTNFCIDEEFIVRYTGNANPFSDSFTWTFSDNANVTKVKIAGEQAYRVEYATGGSKTIQIDVTNANGCENSVTIPVNIFTGPDFAGVLTNDVCAIVDTLFFYSGSHTIVNVNPGTDGVWDAAFPDEISWTSPGIKTFALTLSNGDCEITRNFEVEVLPTPLGEITVTQGCINQPVIVEYGGLDAASIYADYDWGESFDEAISVVKLAGREAYEVIWDAPGIYEIEVEVFENGCSNTISLLEIEIQDVPVADFNLRGTICEFTPVNLFVPNPNSDFVYDWDLDADGEVIAANADSTEISVMWTNHGDRNVTLTASWNGCETVVQKTIRVLKGPDPSFEAPFFCLDETTNKAEGTILYTGNNDVNIDSFVWNFDIDPAIGESATQIPGTQNYDVVYTTPGRKIISLTVTNAQCGSRTFIDTAYVNNFAEFSYEIENDQFCEGATVLFIFTGTAEDDAVFDWNFSDVAGDEVIPIVEDSIYQVIYNSTGPKTISLTIEGVNCSDSYFEDNFVVAEIPESDFTLSSTENCSGDLTTITFTGSATSTADWIWDFADGIANPVGDEVYEVSWPTPGQKVISLFIADGGCLSDTTYQTVDVYDNSATTLMIDTELCIDSIGYVSVNPDFFEPDATWSWEFNDANVLSTNSDSTEFTVSWSTKGTKSIQFSVFGNLCEDTDTTVTINVGEIIPFEVSADTKICSNDSARIVFNLPMVNGRTLEWDFDNPSVVNKISNNREDYYVTWDNVGIKNVKVTINNGGCIRDSTFQVEVTQLPTATYQADDYYCQGDLFSVSPDWNLSAFSIIEWTYNYNGEVGSSTNPNFQLPLIDSGTVEVTLRVFERGCQDIYTRTFQVRETPYAAIDAPDFVCLEGDAIVRLAGELLPDVTYDWGFGGASEIGNLGNETYNLGWNSGGDKTIWLVSYFNGCPSDTAYHTLNVFSIDNLEVSYDTICQHQTVMVNFIEESVDAVGYRWDFGDAEVLSGSGLGPYELFWEEAGEKTVTLNIDGFICNTEQLVQNVFVEPSVFSSINIDIPDLVCRNTDISVSLALTNEGDNPQFEWFLNGSSIGGYFDSTLVANNDVIRARMLSNNACAVNSSVFSNEVIAQIANFRYTGNTYAIPKPICIGDTATLSLDAGAYTILDWEESEDMNEWTSLNSNDVNKKVSPSVDKYYRAVIVDLQGVCVQSTPPTEVRVVPYNPIEAGENLTIRQGDSRILEATRGSDFIWQNEVSIDGDVRNSRVRVRPNTTTTYRVDGLTRDGCPDTDSVTVIVLPPIDFTNVITPNGDGINDLWEIDKIEEYPEAEVFIYDRWGKKLFTSKGYKNPWDGKFNGQLLAPGVYYFVLDLKDGYEPYTGSITILY
ncbi:gliding motility-associated C-terminal domain-containing protein [Marivirga sp. S37H4]|uniref:Gliding motility-associated C-terminal domain-containing protein n=1 Tax=Marivirga aurantiaca TaxID=2802615 RepID=A0A934X0F1_9BACT|nr:gliding motility-associated C-terminal domain-containing protein [Marivirga aurantiaca]MBK6266594.1 gliding motility-associated C-terminal domain-containing protein [Marivirga aurantiaca]